MERPAITYEGVDASAHEEQWLRSLDLPGERVRFDPEVRLRGVDPHDVMDALGTDPLTISKSIVRSSMESNGMGGESPRSILEYEFEGKEGRHNARQFMEEGGREHMYGVVLVRDDRMWAVPIHEEGESGRRHPDGPARELVGFAGKDLDALHPGGVEAMRDDIRKDGPAAGEFYLQPRDGFGSPGPVRLLNSPWQSSASPEELAVANAQIDKAIAKEIREREDPVGVLVDAMTHVSARWRAEKPLPSGPVDPEAALASSKDEFRFLTRGHDVNDANVRMAAAMVATEGREVTAGDISARHLADYMSPGPADSRKGVLAQASAALSGRDPTAAPRTGGKGPSDVGSMPPFGASMVRKGAER